MSEPQKVTVLLADSDLLRRDGVAAVLKANPEVEVIAGCEDGPRALDEIRNLRPDIAIVDLNLPVLHGIELVRRIRGEHLTTKIILVSGTQEDDIVREAVRAGADAYLLKNGPARHVLDAINYVRDGGQYFSPQLGRDGRDRHLLEEPRRSSGGDRGDPDSDREADAYHERDTRLPEGRARQRTADPARFRERIREEGSRDLRDRDYEIMSQMADGIRPILDRLDDIENRVVEMEEGAEPVPADPRGWLNQELARTVDEPRMPPEKFGRAAAPRDMERMIEEAVTRRFQTMAGKLQEQIEEQHIRTIETFVRNIQTKLVQRVSVLEHNVSQQAQAMHQLREYNQRTEDNLTRLISGVDKLAQELPKRLAAASAATEASGRRMIEAPGTAPREAEHEKRRSGSGWKKDIGRKAFWVVALLAVAGWGGYTLYSRHTASAATASAGKTATASGGASAQKALAKPSSSADTKTRMDAARQYVDRKEYATAEDIYKQVLQAEPNNVDAIKQCASVLYREDKLDEAAAMLDRLPKN